jgi:hypothetical protein
MVEHPVNITSELNQVHARLVESLKGAAAFARLSDQFSQLRSDCVLPEPSIVVSFGNSEALQTVRQAYSQLGSNFAVIAMISGFEVFLGRLLLIRRLAEHAPDGKVRVGDFVNFRRTIMEGETRAKPVRLVTKIFSAPPQRIRSGAEWLEGIYAIRVCLVHREGVVGEADVDEASGRLTVKWRKAEIQVAGQKVLRFPHSANKGEEIGVMFVDEERSWDLGDRIEIEPDESQQMALALSFLAGWLRDELHSDLTQVFPPLPRVT